jgi:hypothetical protein
VKGYAVVSAATGVVFIGPMSPKRLGEKPAQRRFDHINERIRLKRAQARARRLKRAAIAKASKKRNRP